MNKSIFARASTYVGTDLTEDLKKMDIPTLLLHGGDDQIMPIADSSFWRPSSSRVKTDLSEDLKKMDIPTLFLHGDDDQIVPIADSAMLAAKLVKKGKMKACKGAPHGMCTLFKDKDNEGLLSFIKG